MAETPYTNMYDIYAKRSYIDKNNFNGDVTPQKSDETFIPCGTIDNFYSDTLLYLHLYMSPMIPMI